MVAMATEEHPPAGIIRCSCGRPLLRVAANGWAHPHVKVVRAQGNIIVLTCGCRKWWAYETLSGKLEKQ